MKISLYLSVPLDTESDFIFIFNMADLHYKWAAPHPKDPLVGVTGVTAEVLCTGWFCRIQNSNIDSIIKSEAGMLRISISGHPVISDYRDVWETLPGTKPILQERFDDECV